MTINTRRADDAHEPRSEMEQDEYRALLNKGVRSKYRNRRAQAVDGRWFDSRAECNRYEELRIEERAGDISDLECQPVLELQPKFRRDGRGIRAITYRADFAYNEAGNLRRVYEDVKGARTGVFNLKWKMAQYRYPDYEFRLEMA